MLLTLKKVKNRHFVFLSTSCRSTITHMWIMYSWIFTFKVCFATKKRTIFYGFSRFKLLKFHHVYFKYLIKFDTTNNSLDFTCTNIKDFMKFTIISCWRLEPERGKTPRWLVFSTKLKAILESKKTQRLGFARV